MAYNYNENISIITRASEMQGSSAFLLSDFSNWKTHFSNWETHFSNWVEWHFLKSLILETIQKQKNIMPILLWYLLSMSIFYLFVFLSFLVFSLSCLLILAGAPCGANNLFTEAPPFESEKVCVVEMSWFGRNRENFWSFGLPHV